MGGGSRGSRGPRARREEYSIRPAAPPVQRQVDEGSGSGTGGRPGGADGDSNCWLGDLRRPHVDRLRPGDVLSVRHHVVSTRGGAVIGHLDQPCVVVFQHAGARSAIVREVKLEGGTIVAVRVEPSSA